MPVLQNKIKQLRQIIQQAAPLAVAFSGGVDSSLLLAVAHDLLENNCIAITLQAPYHLKQELKDASAFCLLRNISHHRIDFDPTDVLGLMDNHPERCYICKKALLEAALESLPSKQWQLADGSNLDDLAEYRPGRRALQELEIRSPLAEAGLTKAEIRSISRQLQLPTWNNAAQSCLLTRFPHNRLITETELQRVEYAEDSIRQLGFKVIRVRSLGNKASIELDQPIQPPHMADRLIGLAIAAGFDTAELDPAGYRTGSMDSLAGWRAGKRYMVVSNPEFQDESVKSGMEFTATLHQMSCK